MEPHDKKGYFDSELRDFEAPEALCQRTIKLGIVRSSDEFGVYFEELKKYLWMGRFGNLDESVPMFSKTIDAIWHEWILFTREYTDFCQNYFGQYMHHTPNIAAPAVTREEADDKRRLRFFVAAYAAIFGPLSPAWGLDTTGLDEHMTTDAVTDEAVATQIREICAQQVILDRHQVVVAQAEQPAVSADCELDPVEQCETPSTITGAGQPDPTVAGCKLDPVEQCDTPSTITDAGQPDPTAASCELDPVEQCETPSTITGAGQPDPTVAGCELDPVEQCETPSTITNEILQDATIAPDSLGELTPETLEQAESGPE